MTKGKVKFPKSNLDITQNNFEPKTSNNTKTEKTEILVAACETVETRDFSSIFARLKKSARKKSASIL